jgi:nucleoside-diphosphate-sugar epimerase
MQAIVHDAFGLRRRFGNQSIDKHPTSSWPPPFHSHTTYYVPMARIIVTGGSGKAGQHIVRELLKAGHQVLNLDLVPSPDEQVYTLKVDLTNAGQVFSALSGQFGFSEPFPPGLPTPADAIVHLAGYMRNMMVPDTEMFRANTASTYNVIEAACKLGIRKLILASSVTVYGVTYAHGDADFPSFPVDETVDVNPVDTYAIAKLCGERVARGFARRFGADIYVLRIGRVVDPHEYSGDMFRGYVEEPEKWKVHGWSYVDSRDLGRMCDLAVRRDGLGFQVFNAMNDSITNFTPTMRFLRAVCPQTPFTREMDEFEAPVSNAKIKELLGFEEEHPWQRYYPARS